MHWQQLSWCANIREPEPHVAQDEYTETVRDTFSVESYNNNDGTQLWSGPWVETGDDGKADGGKIKIDHDYLKIKEDQRAIQRSLDLSAASTAVLTLDYRRADEFKEEYVLLKISTDGGASWVELARWTGYSKDDAFLPASYDISSYMSADTVIGFFTSPDLGGDEFYVDNVQIEYTVGDPLPDPHARADARPDTDAGTNYGATGYPRRRRGS